ncbi:DUF6868 family protein [Silvimonas soli]|uniref:DUF6868 family protein n=1 Tax=Silvimonas soli TaxID=2980100 RepID=UPI0024B32416|nr:hypothetical protein [Silvimonas soli]
MAAMAWRDLLLWTALVNYLLLLTWFVLALLTRATLGPWCARLFGVTQAQYNQINFGGIVLYKLAIVFFLLSPAIVLSVKG